MKSSIGCQLSCNPAKTVASVSPLRRFMEEMTSKVGHVCGQKLSFPGVDAAMTTKTDRSQIMVSSRGDGGGNSGLQPAAGAGRPHPPKKAKKVTWANLPQVSGDSGSEAGAMCIEGTSGTATGVSMDSGIIGCPMGAQLNQEPTLAARGVSMRPNASPAVFPSGMAFRSGQSGPNEDSIIISSRVVSRNGQVGETNSANFPSGVASRTNPGEDSVVLISRTATRDGQPPVAKPPRFVPTFRLPAPPKPAPLTPAPVRTAPKLVPRFGPSSGVVRRPPPATPGPRPAPRFAPRPAPAPAPPMDDTIADFLAECEESSSCGEVSPNLSGNDLASRVDQSDPAALFFFSLQASKDSFDMTGDTTGDLSHSPFNFGGEPSTFTSEGRPRPGSTLFNVMNVSRAAPMPKPAPKPAPKTPFRLSQSQSGVSSMLQGAISTVAVHRKGDEGEWFRRHGMNLN